MDWQYFFWGACISLVVFSLQIDRTDHRDRIKSLEQRISVMEQTK